MGLPSTARVSLALANSTSARYLRPAMARHAPWLGRDGRGFPLGTEVNRRGIKKAEGTRQGQRHARDPHPTLK